MAEDKGKKINKKSFKLGVVLLVTACLLWLGVLIASFLPLNNSAKIGMAGAMLVVGEVAFWMGTILTGKEFVAKYKHYFNFRNRKSKK